MLVAIIREPGEAQVYDELFVRGWQPLPGKHRVIAEFASPRTGAWAVKILETTALASYLRQSYEEGVRVRAFPISTPNEGFAMARRMIRRRMKASKHGTSPVRPLSGLRLAVSPPVPQQYR